MRYELLLYEWIVKPVKPLKIEQDPKFISKEKFLDPIIEVPSRKTAKRRIDAVRDE